MKKNYNSLPRGAGNFLSPPGTNSKEFACWLSNHFKGKSLLVAMFLFMLSTVQIFAQSGETCATAIDLATLTSPFTGTTVGAANDYTPSCGDSDDSPDLVYSIIVPNGYTLNIGQVSNIGVDGDGNAINYDSINSVFYGICGAQTQIGDCRDDPDTPDDGEGSQVEWENTTGSEQTVYWYQDGYTALAGQRVSQGEFVLQWTLTAPPTCNIPTAVSAALTSATAANLSWGAPVTGTVTNYEYAVTTSQTPPASGTTTTATTVNGVAITTNQYTYLHVRANCGTTNGYSEWVTYRFYSGICIPSSPYVNGTGITNVTIGTMSNTTGLEDTNYGNYSAQIVNVGQGVTQMFSIALNLLDAYNVKIWIDWNDNLTFDENEEVYSGASAATVNAIIYGTFTVPATAALGNHRLRIGGLATWNGDPEPCSTDLYYGVYEDYTVNVTTPPSCFTPGAPTVTNAGAGLINIGWTAPTLGATPAGYEYAVDTNLAAPASGTLITGTSVNNVAVTVNVAGYLHVRTNCGGGDFSQWVTIPYYNGVCIPAPLSVDGIGITNVTIGSINNTTTDEAGHFGNYTTQIVNIGQGVTQPFSITFTTNGATYVTKIWADWNDDLDFDDEGEEIFAGESAGTDPAVLSGTFTVPVTATLGNHRLRIGGTDYGPTTPCFTDRYGTYEDYSINVTIPPTCFTPLSPLGAATASGLANLSWTAPTLGTAPAGYEYVVDTNVASPASGTPTTGTSVTGYSGIVDGTYYYLHVRTNCGSGDFSEWVTSAAFRFLEGDTCLTAISLDNLTSPLSSTTVGTANEYTPECGYGSSPDLYYSITVPNGYVLVAGLDASDYNTTTSVFYGSCTDQTLIQCRAFSNESTTWENTTGSTQTVYWVQDGSYNGAGTFTLAWTLTPPPPCNIPRNVVGTMVTLTTANISWTVPVTGNPVSYEYAVTQSSTPPATGTVTTSLSFTNVATVANAYNYVHVRTNCGVDGYSEWVTYEFYSGHCIPANLYSEYNNIISFATGNGFSNISNYDEQIVSYTNNFNNMVVSQEPGGSFTYTVNVDSYTAVEIWIDWNDDLDFNDAGESIATHSNQNFEAAEFTGTVTIPGVIAQGNYRMRVRSRAAFGNPANPCNEYNNGTAQDYAVNIGDPPTCYTPINLSGVAVAQGTANLSWAPQNLGGTPAGYEYIVTTSTSSPAPDQAGTPVTGTTVNGYTGLIDNTWYYLYVRTNCGNGDYSQWAVSRKFRYLAGDTCESAINLATQTSPYTFSTAGAADDYTASCASGDSPDLYYYILVPNGAILNIKQTESNYGTVNSIFYGSCSDQNYLECTSYENTEVVWENTSGSDKTVYWVQDGAWGGNGTFTLEWGVTPPPTCDKPRTLTVDITSLTSTNISWTIPNVSTPLGYEYAVTQSAIPPASGTATTATSVTGVAISPNVDSYLHVRTICSTEDGNSVWVTLPFFSGYCVPKNTQYPAYYITGITTTGGETNFASTSTGFSAFTDYTATHSVSTYPGGSFTMQATTPNTTDNFIFSVWVDWNNDFDFDDTGERMASSGLIRTPATIATITVPTAAQLGTYRMRVRNTHIGSPVPACGDAAGEAEDYTFIVSAVPTCLPPFNPTITPADPGYANLTWSASFLGDPATSYDYVFSPTATPPTDNFTTVGVGFVADAEYDPSQSVYLFVRSNCGDGNVSAWALPASILGTGTPDFLSNSIIVYKDGGAINITSGTTLMQGVTIYDTRGRKLYNQADINNTEVALTGLQIQQQVVIIEVTTARGKVSKRIVF